MEALRANPLQLANLVLTSRSWSSCSTTSRSLRAARAYSHLAVAAQDSALNNGAVMVKDQQSLTEKMVHCILPEDALKCCGATL